MVNPPASHWRGREREGETQVAIQRRSPFSCLSSSPSPVVVLAIAVASPLHWVLSSLSHHPQKIPKLQNLITANPNYQIIAILTMREFDESIFSLSPHFFDLLIPLLFPYLSHPTPKNLQNSKLSLYLQFENLKIGKNILLLCGLVWLVVGVDG